MNKVKLNFWLAYKLRFYKNSLAYNNLLSRMNDSQKAQLRAPLMPLLTEKLLAAKFQPPGATSAHPWKKNNYLKKLATEVKQSLDELEQQ